ASGARKWEHSISGPHRVVPLDASRMLVTVGDHRERSLYALDLTSGAEAWSSKLEEASFHYEHVADVSVGGENVFVAGRRLLCLDPQTGAAKWSIEHPILKAPGASVSFVGGAPLIWDGGSLALLDEKGTQRWSASITGGQKLVSASDDWIVSVVGAGKGEALEARDA